MHSKQSGAVSQAPNCLECNQSKSPEFPSGITKEPSATSAPIGSRWTAQMPSTIFSIARYRPGSTRRSSSPARAHASASVSSCSSSSLCGMLACPGARPRVPWSDNVSPCVFAALAPPEPSIPVKDIVPRHNACARHANHGAPRTLLHNNLTIPGDYRSRLRRSSASCPGTRSAIERRQRASSRLALAAVRWRLRHIVCHLIQPEQPLLLHQVERFLFALGQ